MSDDMSGRSKNRPRTFVEEMEYFDVILSFLHDELSFLTHFGLEPQAGQIVHSKLLGDRLLIVYSSFRLDRGIRIYFSAAHGSKPARFSVFVDAGGGRSLLLDDYLSTHGQKKLLSLFQNTEPKKTVAEFASDVTKFLRIILENSFAAFLRGDAVDIPPFDWSPYT